MANPKLAWLRALMIVAAGFWVMSPAVHGDWLMDDNFYVWQNALVNDPHRLWKIWFTPGSLLEYYPIEATLQMAQWGLWHLNTLGYHLTNIVLHCLDALLVWRLLEKFKLRFAWLGGFLFAVHPTAVESVAWISEFKNTLALAPFLLAMMAWIDFDREGRRRDFWLALVLFLIAMLCKVSMAMFPFIILLYAWWRRGRIALSDVVDALPFTAISLVLGALTIAAGDWFRAAHLQFNTDPAIGDFLTHLALTGQTLAFYFIVALLPLNVLPIYPRWELGGHFVLSFLPWLLFIAMFGIFLRHRSTWGRHALLGVGFFLINLAPFCGLMSATYMEFTWVMLHFLYLPIIGLIGLAVALLGHVESQAAPLQKWIIGMAAAIVLALLALKSNTYATIFAGPEVFWTYTIDHNPNTYIAYSNLGNVMLETGRISEAIADYEKAINLHSTMIEAHNNLGLAYFQAGRTDDAIGEYQEALKRYPAYALAHANLGNALLKKGRTEQAIHQYEEALKTDPTNADALTNLKQLGVTPLPNGKE
jgi:tetratricopeptide (TPR) repeat protein